MRKRTSRIYPDGVTECNEVYAPFADGWNYCDAIYKCDENGEVICLWKKLNDPVTYYFEIYGEENISDTIKVGAGGVHANTLYAIGRVYSSKGDIYKNVICKFDFTKRKWVYIARHQDAIEIQGADDYRIVTDIGVVRYKNINHVPYADEYFYGFDNKTYVPPKSDNTFIAKAARTYNIAVTNKGVIQSVSDNLVYYNFYGDYISILKMDVGVRAEYAMHNGEIYALLHTSSGLITRKITISGSDEFVMSKDIGNFSFESGYTDISDSTDELLVVHTIDKTNSYYDINFNLKYSTKKGEAIVKLIDGTHILRDYNCDYPTFIIGFSGKTITLSEKLDKVSHLYIEHNYISLQKNNETGEKNLYIGTHKINDDGTIEHNDTVTDIIGFEE